MSISLLEDLQTGEYETAVFLTYKISIRFFELMILPRLRRMGVSRIGILIDHRGYQDSLADPLRPEFCGKEYILAPVRLPHGGIQHAKLLWLQEHEKIIAYLGSHNLTTAGYNDQVEVTAKLSSTDSGHIRALRDLHEVVTSIIPPALNYVWKHIEPPPVINDSSTAIALTSSSRPLLNQIIDHVKAVDELRIITPFLDAFALKTLAAAVHAQTIVLDLPKDGADTSLLQAVKAVSELQPRSLKLKNRNLHAKAYQFTTSHTSWLALGSANCTQAALMKSVGEGGNLEFLLLLKDKALPDDGLVFQDISDPATFPYTGRDWTYGMSPTSPVIIEEASYNNGHLLVKWQLPEDIEVSDIALEADGNSILYSSSDSTCAPLDHAPQAVTLKVTINGNITETRAWVINYDALDQKVSRTKLHRWVERIASGDPQQQANSIAEWLEQEFQELIQDHRESENGDFRLSAGFTQKQEKLQPIHQFYEVFAYSVDPKQIRASAKALLESRSNVDPLVLLRVLLMRFTAASPLEQSLNINDDDNFQSPDMQQYFSKRKAAAQSIVKNLNHRLDRLMKIGISWNSIPDHDLITWLRTLFGAVAYIGLSAMEDTKLKEAEILALRFITLLEWIDSLPIVKLTLQKPQVKGPLLLSVGPVAIIAERGKDQTLYLPLRKCSKRFFQDDPRQVIISWRQYDPEDADTLLASSRKSNIWGQIEFSVLRLFEIAPDHIKRLIEQRWGFLVELQEADMHLRPEREDLYVRAKAKCLDMQIWARYDQARRMKLLPVILETTGKVCSKCNESLPAQKWQRLRRGEAVLCDGCHRILLLKG